MNYLVSAEAGAGHSCELAQALRKYIPLESHYYIKSAYQLDYIDPTGIIGLDKFPKSGDTLIVVTGFAFNIMKANLKNFNRVIVIVTDGIFMTDYVKMNEEFKPFEVFLTNCKMQYTDRGKVYYQPFDLKRFENKKYGQLTACHSPFVGEKTIEKGSRIIVAAFNNLSLQYDLIMGQKWENAMQRKAKCHIFVDQIDSQPGYWRIPKDWKGGVGKSGLEAMNLKCLTICRGNFKDYDIPKPPIVECTVKTFFDVLKGVVKMTPHERELLTKAQYDWAIKYTNPDFCAKRILNI
jgi:hypothetical protein